MFAIRAARAFTGRPLIAKLDHSYHGTHDLVMAGTPGVPDAIGGLIVELPWGDPDGDRGRARAAGRASWRRSSSSRSRAPAACVRPSRASSSCCAGFADRLGALLIFDEIISFRVAPGGAQERFGVRPTSRRSARSSPAAIRSRRSVAGPTSWRSSTPAGRGR